MKKLFILFIVVASFFVNPLAAFADSPVKDYHYALSACSGFTIAELQFFQQKFDTAYGWAHKMTTDAQWTGNYNDRANLFSETLGCKPVIDSNGNVTSWVKQYRDWFAYYEGNGAMPQMQ